MFKTLTRSMLAAVVPLVLAFAGPAQAEIRAQDLKFASVNQKGHPQVLGMERFAELVKDKSGGKVTVELFPGGVLGGDVQTISALQGGFVQMTVLNAGILASHAKEFAAVDLPFLFASPQEADAVMDGPFGKKLSGLLPPKGLVSLGYWELGFRNLTNNRHAVKSVDDIKGLKIRTIQSPIMVDLFNTLGANAVPIPYPELYAALETGTVDGQENPFSNILAAKFYEVQKYLTVTRHLYNPQIVLISKKFWDGLNNEEQAVLRAAALEAGLYQRKVAREQDAEALQKLRDSGKIEITELSAAELERMRAAVQPVIEKYKGEIGAETIDLLTGELAKIRKP